MKFYPLHIQLPIYRLTYPILLSFIILFSLSNDSIAQLRADAYYRFESGLTLSSPQQFLYNRNLVQTGLRHNHGQLDSRLAVRVRQNMQAPFSESFDLLVREAYLNLALDQVDLRAGRQMIVWGRSDASQIHDIITPMDLSEFLTQDFTDLRKGVTALSLKYYRNDHTLEMVYLPFRESSSLPRPDSRWSSFPDLEANYTHTKIESYRLSDYQFAARFIGRPSLNLDLEAGVFHVYSPSPALKKNVGTFFPVFTLEPEYYRTTALMFGAELRTGPTTALVSETAFWLDRKFDFVPVSLRNSNTAPGIMLPDILDANRVHFLKSADLLQSMIGIRRDFSNSAISVQYSMEWIPNHDQNLLQDEYFHFASFLYSGSDATQKLRYRILSRYHFNANDFWLNPDLTYVPRDALHLGIGLHLFGGDSNRENYGHLNFGRFGQNTFGYVKLTAYW